jgi:hypothetical protein
MIDPIGPPTPPRADVRPPEPTTVRTWGPQQGQPMPPPTPPRPYQVGPPAYAGAATSSAPAWRKRLLTAVAIIVAAVVGILVANLFVDTSGDNPSSAAQVGSPDPSVVNAPLPTPQPTFSAPPPVTATTDAPPSPLSTTTPTGAQMIAVLHTYIGLLPDHPDQAFALLSPAQQTRSGGRSGFDKQWGGVKSVQLGGAVPHANGTVTARIKVDPKQGKATTANYGIAFVNANGAVLIDKVQTVSRSRHG